jgi:hypothetical protein
MRRLFFARDVPTLEEPSERADRNSDAMPAQFLPQLGERDVRLHGDR